MSSIMFFIVGALVGGFGVLCVFMIAKDSIIIGTPKLSALSMLAQPLSVVVALVALLITAQIGSEQNAQQKKQYTKQIVDAQITPERKKVIESAVDLSRMEFFKKTFGAVRAAGKPEGADEGFAIIGGTSIDHRDISDEMAKRAKLIAGSIFALLDARDEINKCVNSDVCDKDVAFMSMCNAFFPLHYLHGRVDEGGVIWNNTLRAINILDGNFYHPFLLKDSIDTLEKQLGSECVAWKKVATKPRRS